MLQRFLGHSFFLELELEPELLSSVALAKEDELSTYPSSLSLPYFEMAA